MADKLPTKDKEKETEQNDGQDQPAKKPRLELPLSLKDNGKPSTDGEEGGSSSAVPATPELPFKSPKEEVLDDKLAVLSHEQLELLVTRLARADPALEEKILRGIERIEHSMSNFSPRRTEVTPAAMRAFSPRMMMMQSPMGMMPMGMGMGMGMASMGMHGGEYEDFGQNVDTKSIRRKIRAAFQKIKEPGDKKRRRGEDKPTRYRLQGELIRSEMKKAKDWILVKGNNNNGLEAMEAITEEYVTVGSEVGEQNVEGYDDLLQELAQDWVEVFLSESTNELGEERRAWADKLFVWDKSADEEEGTFSAARAAAKLGWSDTHLQQVLAGDHIGKYTEPQALSIARCNILEREKKFEQALNLAKAVDLDHYTARFLIKLGRMDEAIETARNLSDPFKVFSIAQVARALDVKVAFSLAIYSIALPHAWNQQNLERALWLCDLAVSNKMMDELVTQVEKHIPHKGIQFEIAKILKDKEAFETALKMGAIAMRPLPEKPKEEEKDKPAEQQQQGGSSASAMAPAPTLQQILQGQEIDPGSIIPVEVPKWLWELSFDMIVLEKGTRAKMEEVLQDILSVVKNVEQLISLAKEMSLKKEYDLILTVGKKCIELVNAELQADIEDQIKVLTEQNEIQQAQKKGVKNAVLLQKLNTQRVIGYNQNFDNQKQRVAYMMLQACLDSKIPPDPLQMNLVETNTIIRKFSPIADEEIKQILEELCQKDNIKDPNHLTQLANILRTRKEYLMVLDIGKKVQQRLQELNEERIERETWQQRLQQLQSEQMELLNKKKSLDGVKLDELNELLWKAQVQRIVPYYTQYSEAQLDTLHYNIIEMMMRTVLDTTAPEEPQPGQQQQQDMEEEKEPLLTNEQINDFITNQCLDSPFVPSPSNRITLLRTLREYGRKVEYPDIIQLVNTCGAKILVGIEKLRQHQKERERVYQPLQMLRQELEQLVLQASSKKSKKGKEDDSAPLLPPEKQERLQTLENELEALPPMPYYDPNSQDQYDNLVNQTLQQMLSIALDSYVIAQQQQQQAMVAAQSLGVMALTQLEQEKKKPIEKEFVEKLVLDTIVANCKSPDNLLSIASTLSTYARTASLDFAYKLVVQLGDICFKTLNELDTNRASRFPAYHELTRLRQEKAELESKNKTISEAQQARLEELELEERIAKIINPKFVFLTANKTNEMRLKVARAMHNAALDAKQMFEQKIKKQEEEAESQSQSQMDVEGEEERLSEEDIVEGRQRLDKQIRHVIDTELQHLKDPNHCISVAKDYNARGECDVVLEFVRRCQATVQELDAQRIERETWQTELHALINEQSELQAKRQELDDKQLEQLAALQYKQAELKLYPSFHQLDLRKLDTISFNAAQEAVTAVLNARNRLEALINQDEEITTEEADNQREGLKEKLDLVMNEFVFPIVKDPSNLFSIANDLKRHGEHARVPELARQCVDRINQLEEVLKIREEPRQWISVLTDEQATLAVSKKSLDAKMEKKLAESQQEVDSFEALPHYATNSMNSFENSKHRMVRLNLETALEALSQANTKISDMESQDEELLQSYEAEREEKEKQLQAAFDFCLTNVESPSDLLQMVNDLRNAGEIEKAYNMAQFSQKKVAELLEKSQERTKTERQVYRLQSLEEQLTHQRKALETSDKQRLRELLVQTRMNQSLVPQYAHIDTNSADNLTKQACDQMIHIALQERDDVEQEVKDDQSLSMEEVEARRQAAKEKLEAKVQEAITDLRIPRNLYAIAQFFHNKLEYGLVILVGTRCQEIIAALEAENDKRDAINLEINELEQKQVVNPSEAQKQKIEELRLELEEFPVVYDNNYTLDQLNLRVAELMINAGKVEERSDVLRDQAVLTFKINPTIPKFEEVKILTDESDWPAVKKDLLAHILKPASSQQTQLGGFSWSQATIDPNAKVELLLNEGLWKETIAIFPEPPNGSLEMLERLYLEVEKNSPKAVEDLLPIIEKHAIHSYQQYILDNPNLDRLLDQVQKRNPDFICGLFERCNEKLLLNIMPKQYEPFARYLEVFKKRINDDLGREEDWENFMADIVKGHKGKRKLMQIMQHSGLKP
ncbi:hypothetical protein QOT17_012173 [Balamuthia mandrillaris]